MPKMPLRIGYSWGGGDLKELGMGFGLRRGMVMFDFGFAFRNGMWLHTCLLYTSPSPRDP